MQPEQIKMAESQKRPSRTPGAYPLDSPLLPLLLTILTIEGISEHARSLLPYPPPYSHHPSLQVRGPLSPLFPQISSSR